VLDAQHFAVGFAFQGGVAVELFGPVALLPNASASAMAPQVIEDVRAIIIQLMKS
jgi:hypothetical protein